MPVSFPGGGGRIGVLASRRCGDGLVESLVSVLFAPDSRVQMNSVARGALLPWVESARRGLPPKQSENSSSSASLDGVPVRRGGMSSEPLAEGNWTRIPLVAHTCMMLLGPATTRA